MKARLPAGAEPERERERENERERTISGVSALPGIMIIVWPKRAENFATVGMPTFCDFGPVT